MERENSARHLEETYANSGSLKEYPPKPSPHSVFERSSQRLQGAVADLGKTTVTGSEAKLKSKEDSVKDCQIRALKGQ